jgi:hypothetical protein
MHRLRQVKDISFRLECEKQNNLFFFFEKPCALTLSE